MAIQPIDLQTLYTQMDKVSKTVVQQQQQAQLRSSMEIDGLVKKDIEKKETVEKPEEENKMAGIKNDSSSNESNQNPAKKDKKEEKEEPILEVIKDPSLGKNIDISG